MRSTTSPFWFAVAVLAAGLTSCSSSSSENTGAATNEIIVGCTDVNENPIVVGGAQVVELNVGDPIFCSVELFDLPRDARSGLEAEPPQYEWDFASSDGGAIYDGTSKPIRWETYSTNGPSVVDTFCQNALMGVGASAMATSSCDTVCCKLGANDYHLQTSAACEDQEGTASSLWRCPGKGPSETVCCELPVEYPDGPVTQGFIPGPRQITTKATCESFCGCTASCSIAPVIECGEPYIVEPVETYGNLYGQGCRCCRLADGSVRSLVNTFGELDRCRDELGGALVDWDECWDYPGTCGLDERCEVEFCERSAGSVDLERTDLCEANGGSPLGEEHDGSSIGCCKRSDDGTVFPVEVLGTASRVSAGTREQFVARAEGTVTIRIRQLGTPPILFQESFSGSSLVQLRIGALTECAPPAFEISGTFTERYNCAEGSACVDQDQSAPIDVSAGTGTGEYTFSSGDWSGSGTLCGSVFDWQASAPDYTETGMWIFSDAQNFTKTSDYTYLAGGGGTCTAAASANSTPPPPPPIGPCP